jgi:heterotetrameric sarcosine oxidase delta subunit
MILIPCPHCGPRNSNEFRHSGELKPRPDVTTVTPQEWRDYLYIHRNPSGWTTETWYHAAGCRRFFTLTRHTLTNEIRTDVTTDATTDATTDVTSDAETTPGTER